MRTCRIESTGDDFRMPHLKLKHAQKKPHFHQVRSSEIHSLGLEEECQMRLRASWRRQTFLQAAVFVGCLVCSSFAQAEVASIYGGSDGFCGRRTASGERMNCASMTAAHRTLPFGTRVTVCHQGCVTVRINDRGPFVRGRHIDLTPAAARAIGLRQTGKVTLSLN